jgi:hypothetical protein
MVNRPHTIEQNQQSTGNQQQAENTITPAAIPEVLPLPDVLRQIGRDSRRDPQQYLDETIVPFGGE